MTNETTLVLKRSEPIDFIVTETAMEKGTICKLSGPRGVAANAGTGDVIAGIARREKIAGDGRTRLSIFTGPGDIFRMTAAAGPTIAAGSIVAVSGPRGVAPSAADGDVFAGILAREKIASDGRTQVPVFIDGVFDCTFTGTVVPQGSQVSISGPNILKIFTAGDSEDGVAFGKLLETTTAVSLEVNQVQIGR